MMLSLTSLGAMKTQVLQMPHPLEKVLRKKGDWIRSPVRKPPLSRPTLFVILDQQRTMPNKRAQ